MDMKDGCKTRKGDDRVGAILRNILKVVLQLKTTAQCSIFAFFGAYKNVHSHRTEENPVENMEINLLNYLYHKINVIFSTPHSTLFFY